MPASSPEPPGERKWRTIALAEILFVSLLLASLAARGAMRRPLLLSYVNPPSRFLEAVSDSTPSPFDSALLRHRLRDWVDPYGPSFYPDGQYHRDPQGRVVVATWWPVPTTNNSKDGLAQFQPRDIPADCDSVPDCLDALIPQSMTCTFRARTECLKVRGGHWIQVPTFELTAIRTLPNTGTPSAGTPAGAAWIHAWSAAADARRMFLSLHGGFPAVGAGPHPDQSSRAPLPEAATIDDGIFGEWGPQALWIEQNEPYASVLIGSTEYRVHDFIRVRPDSAETTYCVQVYIRPREYFTEAR